MRGQGGGPGVGGFRVGSRQAGRDGSEAGGRAGGEHPDSPGAIAVEHRAGQEERGPDGEEGDGDQVPRDMDHRLGGPRPTEGTGRQHVRRQVSHDETLASNSMDAARRMARDPATITGTFIAHPRSFARCTYALMVDVSPYYGIVSRPSGQALARIIATPGPSGGAPGRARPAPPPRADPARDPRAGGRSAAPTARAPAPPRRLPDPTGCPAARSRHAGRR